MLVPATSFLNCGWLAFKPRNCFKKIPPATSGLSGIWSYLKLLSSDQFPVCAGMLLVRSNHSAPQLRGSSLSADRQPVWAQSYLHRKQEVPVCFVPIQASVYTRVNQSSVRGASHQCASVAVAAEPKWVFMKIKFTLRQSVHFGWGCSWSDSSLEWLTQKWIQKTQITCYGYLADSVMQGIL